MSDRILDTSRIWDPDEIPPAYCPRCGRVLEKHVWSNAGSDSATEDLVCWQGWGPLRRRWEVLWNGPFPQHYRYWVGRVPRPMPFDRTTGAAQ